MNRGLGVGVGESPFVEPGSPGRRRSLFKCCGGGLAAAAQKLKGPLSSLLAVLGKTERRLKTVLSIAIVRGTHLDGWRVCHFEGPCERAKILVQGRRMTPKMAVSSKAILSTYLASLMLTLTLHMTMNVNRKRQPFAMNSFTQTGMHATCMD
ncbi:hypothetical protein SKAU_G00257550 [Synaphobranchus kaupii]|uniref:Uncharacterized protein n=1 Tax=Synaphobranchus kaupii TaxID=118154 RepID=A0A9Q1F435_SYNKA|nr:hypothetical protein SKAU_G00257550 [Synaphobranchus kaupii]